MKYLLLPFILLFSVHMATAQVAENDAGFAIDGTGFNGKVNAMAVQGNGKVIVGGEFTSYNGTTRNYIARLNADGTLDGSFDASTTLGAAVLAVAIDASGNIVCGGAFSAGVKRLLTTGINDATFALAGTGLNGPVNAVAVQADGSVYIGGSFTSYNGTSRNSIARLTSTGTLDTGFDPGTGLNGFVRKIGLQADGKIVVVGGSSGFNAYNGTSRDNIVRIESTGAIDAGFVPPANLKARMYDVKFQTDNKIIITGEYNGDNTSIFNGVARLNTNGSIDNTFTAAFFQGGRSILIQADGKIVIGGLIFAKSLKRVNSDGTTDNAFMDGADGFFEPSFAEVASVVLQDGKILAGGDFDVFNGTQRNRMARITSCSSVGITTHPLNKTVCTGATATLTIVATGSALTYQWQRKDLGNAYFQNVSDGTGLSGTLTATLSINSAVAPVAQAYRCLVSDANCTSTGRSAEVIYQTPPTVNTHPQPQTVCAGINAVFTVDVTNASQYVWQEDKGQGFEDLSPSAVYLNTSTATLTVVSNASLTGYKYRCRVGTCLPQVTTNDALLTVNTAPVITAQPATSVSACSGTNPQFSVTATGGTGYQWQEKIGVGSFTNITDGGIYGGATTSTLTLTGVTVTQNSYQYRCIVTAACNATSNAGVLTVYATPSFTTHPANSTKCVGGSATFTVALTAAPVGITYQWQEKVGSGSYVNITNGGIYSGATTTTLSIIGVTAAMDANKYRCVAGTCDPSAASFEADLTVFDPLTITTQPASLTACPAADATFTAVAAGDGTITYQWQEQVVGGNFININNGGSYSGATSSTLTITGVTTALSGYRYRCSTSNSVCTAITTSNATLTVPASVSITSQPATTRVLCGTGNTTFSVSITPTTTYQWQVNTGTGFTDIADGGIYSGATSSVLTLTAATPAHTGFKFRCKLGPCPSTQVLSTEGTLTVNAPPEISLQPVNQTICSGGNTTFTITATGTSLTYQWRQNGGNITDGTLYSGATTSTLTITGAQTNLNNVEYTCRVTGASGCSPVESTAGKLTVNSILLTTQPAVVPTFCEGGNASYTVAASGPDLTYQWQSQTPTGSFTNITNGGVYSGATTATLSITTAAIAMHGTAYRCVVSGLCPSVNSNSVLLQMFQKPAKPVINVDLTNPESPVLSVAGSGFNTWKWFKNGTQTSTSSTLINPGEGTYTVLVALNGCESVISDPKAIIVTESSYVNESRVFLYPNPAFNKLIVSLAEFKPGEDVDIMLVDLLGRSMERTSGPGGGEKEINVSGFQSGRYIVRMRQGQQQRVSHFIKTNQ